MTGPSSGGGKGAEGGGCYIHYLPTIIIKSPQLQLVRVADHFYFYSPLPVHWICQRRLPQHSRVSKWGDVGECKKVVWCLVLKITFGSESTVERVGEWNQCHTVKDGDTKESRKKSPIKGCLAIIPSRIIRQLISLLIEVQWIIPIKFTFNWFTFRSGAIAVRRRFKGTANSWTTRSGRKSRLQCGTVPHTRQY